MPEVCNLTSLTAHSLLPVYRCNVTSHLISLLKEKYWLRNPRASSQHKVDSPTSCPEGQRAGNKGQGQEVEKEEGEGNLERGQEYLSQRDRGLHLHGGETGVTHRKMVVYEGKGENPMLD